VRSFKDEIEGPKIIAANGDVAVLGARLTMNRFTLRCLLLPALSHPVEIVSAPRAAMIVELVRAIA